MKLGTSNKFGGFFGLFFMTKIHKAKGIVRIIASILRSFGILVYFDLLKNISKFLKITSSVETIDGGKKYPIAFPKKIH